MGDSGYIKLYRRTFENPAVMKDADHLAVWIYLLGSVAWTEKEVLFNGEITTLQPGQGVFTITEMSNALGISRSKIKRILDWYGSCSMIETEVKRWNTLISIVSWHKWNGSETEVKRKWNGSETPTLYKEKEEGEEYKNTARARAREVEAVPLRCLIPPTVDMVREYCQSRGNTIDPEEFMDWYEERDWMTGKTPMKDWQATIRGWERRRKRENEQGKPKSEGRLSWIDEL